MIHHSAFIHPKAHVDRETCVVGAGSKIWQLASVTRHAILGQDCVVWPFAMLDGPIFGDRCVICSGVAMGPGFLIGNDVFIGPNVTICNDMWPEVAKEGFDYDTIRLGAPSVIVEDGASIGANAVILPGVRIRAGAVVAAGAVVDCNVPSGNVRTRNGYDWGVPSDRRARRMRSA